MTTAFKKPFKIISFLLQFPNDRMLSDLAAYRDNVVRAFTESDRQRVRALVEHLTGTELVTLQECFSAAFDLDPSTCLNLTYHQYGDDRERGAALAEFVSVYEAIGFSPDPSELPDYLPMVLELLSQSRNEDGYWLLFDHRDTITALADRLGQRKSPYAGILQILAEMLASGADMTRRRSNG